jgi:outer membrane protein TolC
MTPTPKLFSMTLLFLPWLILGFSLARGQNPTGSFRRDSLFLARKTAGNADSLIQEKLVTLALQGPQYQVTKHQIKYSQYQLSKIKKSWLNLLSLSANFNDQTFAKTSNPAVGTAQIYYPKYFFGVTIPLGVIFSIGPDIKGARENVEIARDNQEQRARQIRSEVLSKYKQWRNYSQLIGLQNTIVDDEQAAVGAIEKKFRDGTATFDQYNQLSKEFNNDLATKLNLQLSQDLMKLEIEELIGTNLENVIK